MRRSIGWEGAEEGVSQAEDTKKGLILASEAEQQCWQFFAHLTQKALLFRWAGEGEKPRRQQLVSQGTEALD